MRKRGSSYTLRAGSFEQHLSAAIHHSNRLPSDVKFLATLLLPKASSSQTREEGERGAFGVGRVVESWEQR